MGNKDPLSIKKFVLSYCSVPLPFFSAMKPDIPPSPGEISMCSSRNMTISNSTMTMINNPTTMNGIRGAHAVDRQYMPSKPAIFHGRENLVQEVSQLLCDENAQRVRILGPGGMGKTSLALAVVESSAVQSKFGSRCYWVPCVDAPSLSLLLQVLYTQLYSGKITATVDILSDILAELEHVKSPILLVLDNFETPWFPSQGTTQAVDDILFQLNKCNHVSILLTMRFLGTNKAPCNRIKWHTRHLQPVSNEASRLIFRDMYPDSKEDPDLDALLAAVGHMPYAVILMAKSGETCGFTASKLLEEWNRVGTHMISHSGSPEENMNRSISLSVKRDFVQQNPDALLLLQTLALLPAGTSIENLRHWAPNINSLSSAIGTLSDAALLLQSEGTPRILSILPVVQSFMHDQLAEEVFQNVHKGCYHFVLDHISQCEDQPQDVASLLITEDRNIRFILLNSNPKNVPISPDRHAKCLLYFAAYSSRWRNSDISKQALSLARSSGDQKMVAQVFFVLATNHGRKNAYDIAEQFFSESYGLFSQFADPDSRQQALVCGLLVARCKMVLHQPLKLIIEYLQSLWQVNAEDDFQKAHIKAMLGDCQRHHGQFSEALDVLEEAKDLFEKTGHLDKVAETLGGISDVYFLSSQFDKSLALIREACEIAKCSGVAWSKTKAAYMNFKHARCLISLQRDTEALPILQECLSTFESTGELFGAARCFKHLGMIHARQGNFYDACVAFEGAIAKLTELDDTTVEGRHEIVELERLKEEAMGLTAK